MAKRIHKLRLETSRFKLCELKSCVAQYLIIFVGRALLQEEFRQKSRVPKLGYLGSGNDNGNEDGNGNGNGDGNDNGNGDGNGNGTGNGNNGGDNGDGNENQNVNGGGDRPVARECTY
ncbi:hypothetical protein Tco_1503316 [Tanacetum coccineum]